MFCYFCECMKLVRHSPPTATDCTDCFIFRLTTWTFRWPTRLARRLRIWAAWKRTWESSEWPRKLELATVTASQIARLSPPFFVGHSTKVVTRFSEIISLNFATRSIWKMLGPFATASRRTPPVLILHCHSPGVATVARRLRIDVHNNNDNAWQRGPLWPHRIGPITAIG